MRNYDRPRVETRASAGDGLRARRQRAAPLTACGSRCTVIDMRKPLVAAVAILAVVALAGCVPGPNQLVGSPHNVGEAAGFWQGLLHGFIALFTFIVSLFSDKVDMYEVNNNGTWYNLGFLLGVMMFFGGGGGGAGRGSRGR